MISLDGPPSEVRRNRLDLKPFSRLVVSFCFGVEPIQHLALGLLRSYLPGANALPEVCPLLI